MIDFAMTTPADPAVPLGQRCRRMFRRHVVRRSWRSVLRSLAKGQFAVLPYVYGVRPLMFLVRIAWCLDRFGPDIARSGPTRFHQALAMLKLGWGGGIDPILYPALELYRPERRSWADHALSRFEIGCGLLCRLHKVLPTRRGKRSPLGDKLETHTICRAHGLPCADVLLHAQDGNVHTLAGAGEVQLDRDLFIKPRASRGCRKSFWLKRVAPFVWHTKHGETWTRADLIAYLEEQSSARDILVQGALTNDPDIADLADRSLIAIRVITCMNATGAPIVTHAMLRVISKLEPAWRSKKEHAAAIDLATGRMGQMCNDKDLRPGQWTDTHPITHAPVNGRVLRAWPDVRALAVAAHGVFSDRMLVGWDIAITPAGPVILEGNSYPDVHFLQRVHQQPIGISILGPLLQAGLDALDVRYAVPPMRGITIEEPVSHV